MQKSFVKAMIFPSKAQMWKGGWIFILNFKLYRRRAARLKYLSICTCIKAQ